MKKLISIAILLFCVINIQAQNTGEENKNEIDVVISDFLDGAVQFKYERMLGDHFSWGIGLGLKGKESLISLSGLDTEKIKTNKIVYSGFKIIPEVRYYFRKDGVDAMKGFYLGAYLKYSHYTSDLDGRFISEALETFEIEIDAKIKITSIGLMAGYKLPLSDKFSIDFLIAGPGTGFYGFTFDDKQDLPDEFYEDLNDALENFHIFDLLDGDFRFNAVHRKSNFNLLSFRYGISLGYSF